MLFYYFKGKARAMALGIPMYRLATRQTTPIMMRSMLSVDLNVENILIPCYLYLNNK